MELRELLGTWLIVESCNPVIRQNRDRSVEDALMKLISKVGGPPQVNMNEWLDGRLHILSRIHEEVDDVAVRAAVESQARVTMLIMQARGAVASC